MHMATERRWDEFPYRLRSLLENIRNTAMPKTVSDIPHREKKIWSALVHAVDAIETSGFSSIDGLRKSLDGIENPYWWTRLTYVLEEWANNPDMPLDAPVTAPAPAVKKECNRKRMSRRGYVKSARQKPRSQHAAAVEASSPDWAWLEFSHSRLFIESKSLVILYDYASQRIADHIITMRRHDVYAVIYGKDAKLNMPDHRILGLNLIADNSMEPVDILISTCEKFNSRREIFSGVDRVHEALIRLGRTGLVGPETKKLGLGYFGNDQYDPNYLATKEFLFKADAMITEVGDFIEGYPDAGRAVVEMKMELEKRKINEDGV
jgi:hypothetical protein